MKRLPTFPLDPSHRPLPPGGQAPPHHAEERCLPTPVGALLKRLVILVLAISLAAPWLEAARHPALPPNVDSTKCLQCHTDVAKGKFVHSAMAKGCLSCHEIRVYRDITRVKLITATPLDLCLTCHANMKAENVKGEVHPPSVRDCLKCHNPHASENKDLLLQATSGDTKQANLCLSCHTTGMDIPKGGSRHPALDMGCDTCHIIHKSGDPAQREFAYHLTKDAPALCVDCHDVTDPAIIKAHRNQPFAKADCLQCHDPHQSRLPNLMQAFLHNPFAGKECDICHASAKDGKVVLTQKDVKSLCVMCHDDVAKQIAAAKVPHPGAQGDCTDCHNPHAGRSPGFLQPGPVAVCLACHTDQAEQSKKRYLHQPAFEQGCATCHTPHGGDNAHLLRVASVNALCLECHGPDASPQKVQDQPLMTIFNGQVELPQNYFTQVPILPIKYGLGHPTVNHPVSDVLIPPTNTVFKMNCLTCHQPHSGNEPGMLVKDQKNNMSFCTTCHNNPVNLSDVREPGK